MIEECKKAIEKEYFQKALKLGKQTIKMYPNNPESYLCLGIAHYGLGNTKKAMEYLKKAEELTNDNEKLAIIYRYMGETLFKIRKLNEALIYLNKAIKLTKHPNENMAHVLNKIANIYHREKNLEKASEYYKEAFKIGKKENMNEEFMMRTAYDLRYVLFRLGRNKDIIEIFEDLLSYGSNNNNLYIVCLSEINLGSTYLEMGNKDTAIKYFTIGLKHAQEIKNKDLEAIAYKYLGETLNNKKYLDKAEEILKSTF